MHTANETIAAVSTSSPDRTVLGRTVIRISGSDAFTIVSKLTDTTVGHSGVNPFSLSIHGVLVEGFLYLFRRPSSYTGEDMAELHCVAARPVAARMMEHLLQNCRQAEPGEFTLRAYLNGKMDLSQAEAVAEVISGSNDYQLAAAQRLLTGGLADQIKAIRNQLLDLISLIEAGLDFSNEEIQFIHANDAKTRITDMRDNLETLLAGQVACEEAIDLPSVGLCGATNAGKSTLLNTLLGSRRSIVSDQAATTRDTLTGLLQLPRCRCVLFDCAGLATQPMNPLDKLAQGRAVESIHGANIAIFCVDITKQNLDEDRHAWQYITGKTVLTVATKCDQVTSQNRKSQLARLADTFAREFLPVSVSAGEGLNELIAAIEKMVLSCMRGASEVADRIAIVQRHREVLSQAVEDLQEAGHEIEDGNEEVAAMLLRGAYEVLGGLERENVDEEVLARIFSQFCIGK